MSLDDGGYIVRTMTNAWWCADVNGEMVMLRPWDAEWGLCAAQFYDKADVVALSGSQANDRWRSSRPWLWQEVHLIAGRLYEIVAFSAWCGELKVGIGLYVEDQALSSGIEELGKREHGVAIDASLCRYACRRTGMYRVEARLSLQGNNDVTHFKSMLRVDDFGLSYQDPGAPEPLLVVDPAPGMIVSLASDWERRIERFAKQYPQRSPISWTD